MKNYLLIFLLIFSPMIAKAEPILSFGVVPQQSASKLAKVWNPILTHLSKQSGVKIRFATAPDIPTFEKRLAAGVYDLAYMNPYHYVVFHEEPGYQAINKARGKHIKGIIVSAKNSKYNELKDLNHRKLAFPAPAAFAASILTQSDLSRRKVLFLPKYISSHESVYRTVAKGIYPAGGGNVRTFKSVAPEIREKLQILWTTKGYTPHAIATHPRIDKKHVKKIQQAFINMEQHKDGLKLLQGIKIKGFEKACNNDWRDVRDLRINLLDSE